ncbi:CCA tRNA nucleotidyltransferase [Commensalibacter papalotli (ex Botero et al. 2024)]|uniref:tRNA nucleotidyltransferase/poly(A) polymerase (PcnB) (PDB:3WFR) n=1 Tax=Commensalibacter papalotli (ex Botero et al. 2024) TaxID=2972766 RepID=A0ABN8W9N6_9PROT|nr:CCA tRNA nucleotidyltransferase [Commensalibacter papalotli (ex Botero et al. 2024)]CAI3937688.1 tRNA nucleotidyltransferase/poly(A) polymerase (PcnB) (PDB:3WFR) [Commensalibacter papalotli (ex Botero et al. 2024)]CAI3937949.1 tRNA nucleotidyltransferase/poly(A) polymerase (PcnB) (PDB:3WFR) [Commensalibacter papalotli (ex Botero et al. 2024)]
MGIIEKIPCLDDLNQIWNSLPDARLVGGVVRDLLANKPIADIDLATSEPPEKVMETLKNKGISVIPTGLSHGTVTAVINHCPYEITTLRKDVVTDGRHAQVVWSNSWEEDAARRDFTINAMYCDKEGHIWDFHHGQADLKAGIIRFIGNAKERIQEDVLRILRFFRFYARYGKGKPDSEAITAIQSLNSLISNLSAERVWSELQKILMGPIADQIIGMMDQYDVLPELMPFGYNLFFFQKFVQIGAPPQAVLRLAGLVTASSQVVAKKLRLSRKQEKLLWGLQKDYEIDPLNTEIQKRQLRTKYDLELLIGKSWLLQTMPSHNKSQTWSLWRHSLMDMEQPIFPVMGQDLINIGIQPGPDIGKALKTIQEWWLHHGCYADQQECLKWFKSHRDKRIN